MQPNYQNLEWQASQRRAEEERKTAAREVLKDEITALRTRCEELKRDKAKIERGLTHIYEETEGYEDGAPDAGPKARLANAILPTVRSLLAVVRAARKEGQQAHEKGESKEQC